MNRSWARPGGSPAPQRVVPPHVGIVTPAEHRMPTTDELNDWMRAVGATGDRTALAALFRHFAPRLKAFMMRSGSSEAMAEEIAQDAMVQLWRRAGTFDPARAHVSTWLYTIARNLRIDRLRREAGLAEDAAEPLDEDALLDDPALGPDAQLLLVQRERRVRHALAALPPEQARVLHLSFYEEHAHAAIADDLGIPLGTVKSRIRLAVAQLRRLLDGIDP